MLSVGRKLYIENLFFLISRFIIQLRNCNKQVVLLGDLNAYTTDAIGWNGRDALWSEVADIEFQRESKCMYETIDRNGKDLLRLCQTCELRILNGLSWPDGPRLDPSPTRPPTDSERSISDSGSQSSSFQATVDLMRRLAASSFHFAMQFVSNNIIARATDRSGSVLDYVAASSSVISRVRSFEVLPVDKLVSDPSRG